MNGRPVTIRLLDPPLHEFLPHDGPPRELARTLNVSTEYIIERMKALWKTRCLCRGCRLGFCTRNTEMQVRRFLRPLFR